MHLFLAFNSYNEVPASSSCLVFRGKHGCEHRSAASSQQHHWIHRCRQKLELCVGKLKLGLIHLSFLKFCCCTPHSSMHRYCCFSLRIPCEGRRVCKCTRVQVNEGASKQSGRGCKCLHFFNFSAVHWDTVKRTFKCYRKESQRR